MEMNLGGVKFDVSENDMHEVKTIIVAAGHSTERRMWMVKREFSGLVDVSFETKNAKHYVKLSGNHSNVSSFCNRLDEMGVKMYNK